MRRIMARGASLGRFPVGLNPYLKFVLAMALFALSSVANAVTVLLVSHNQTSGGGAVSSLITDGSHVSGIAGATTAVWDWDGTSLTSTGLYSQVGSIGSSPFASTILSDQITDLSIDTSTGTGSATAYSCIEGTFLGTVGASGCGGYNLGTNFADESTTTWGPGTATSQTLGGDDVLTGGAARSISAYDFGPTVIVPGVEVTAGKLMIGNGIPLGSTGATFGGGELMTFTIGVVPVPAAIWLFGSALGLLGWVRRKAY